MNGDQELKLNTQESKLNAKQVKKRKKAGKIPEYIPEKNSMG
jgi:hypothetical protein